MEPNSEHFRDQLLSRLPQPENLSDYRSSVAVLLDKNRRNLKREKWYSGAVWSFVVVLGTVLLTGAGMKLGSTQSGNAAFLGTFACFFLICGAVELLKHFINRSRVDLLTEIKQLQLQVLELQKTVRKH